MSFLPMLRAATAVADPALACAARWGEVQMRIAAKPDADSVANYVLEAVTSNATQQQVVAGGCAGGANMLVYQLRGA